MDNETRQNLQYKIILVALELRAAISKYQEKYINKFNEEDILNVTNQKALKSIRDFLQPFKYIIKETEGDYITLNKVLYIMDFMVEYFKMSFKKYATNPKLYNCIHTSWHAFNKYYFKTDEVTAYSTALLLAPYWRKNYIIRN